MSETTDAVLASVMLAASESLKSLSLKHIKEGPPANVIEQEEFKRGGRFFTLSFIVVDTE